MSCSQCELKRAKNLYLARMAMEQFELEEFLTELEYRWPNRFYVEQAPDSWRVLQRNTVAPYVPAEVCNGFSS